MEEIWLPTKFETYEVSNLGNVRTTAFRCVPGDVRVLRRTVNNEGYRVWTPRGHSQQKVHRTVLETFVGPPPDDKPYGCHNNGDPSDARLENLRWDSPTGNTADEIVHGTHNRGSRNNTTKLTPEQVLEIRADTTSTNAALADKYGVNHQNISAIKLRQTWKHI